MALIQTTNEKQKKEIYNTTSEGNLHKISFRSREADKWRTVSVPCYGYLNRTNQSWIAR